MRPQKISIDRLVVIRRYMKGPSAERKSKLTPTKEIVLLLRTATAVIYLTSTIPVPDLTHLSKHKERRGPSVRSRQAMRNDL